MNYSQLYLLFFYMNIYSLSSVTNLYICQETVGVRRDEWKEQPYTCSCQNQELHVTSFRAYVKAYLLLKDEVYHSIALQASVYFRLPSDFRKLLREGFVNIIETTIICCAILLMLSNIFFSTIGPHFFSLVKCHYRQRSRNTFFNIERSSQLLLFFYHPKLKPMLLTVVFAKTRVSYMHDQSRLLIVKQDLEWFTHSGYGWLSRNETYSTRKNFPIAKDLLLSHFFPDYSI